MSIENPTSVVRGLAGLGLRSKLTLGFVGLLAILIAVGVESVALLSDLGGSIDVILRENYKSVIACEQMKESLERMDSGALFGLAGEIDQGRTLATASRPAFDAALQTELGNITLPGEGERAERLRQLFAAYAPVLQRVLAPEVLPAERRSLYFQQLYPTFRQIKATADEILRMNQQSMEGADERARGLARDATREMAILLLAGTAVAGLCVLFLSSAILGPLERLTRAAGEIEAGKLDVAVPVASGDELGRLAAAFNSMTAALRELRETDQARLLRARRFAQGAIDSLPEAIAVISPERRVELANRAASVLLGLRPGEPLPEAHAGWLPALVERAESGRFPAGGVEPEVRLSAQESERLFAPRAVALRPAQGGVEGVVVMIEEVTERRRRRELHARLLANAAHDLAAAVDPARSALEALTGPGLGPLNASQEERLAGARAEVARLGEIAAGLLAMSRLEERRERLHVEPVAPGELVEAAAGGIEARFREQGVRLDLAVDPAAPRVLADRERSTLVLLGLLRNALAHTPAGGSVAVRAEPGDGRVRFAVADTGRGIPAVHRERLFEPFYQVPGGEDLGGAGLGLANAREVVQAHGGEIHVESEEGRGTTVWLTLPAAPG